MSYTPKDNKEIAISTSQALEIQEAIREKEKNCTKLRQIQRKQRKRRWGNEVQVMGKAVKQRNSNARYRIITRTTHNSTMEERKKEKDKNTKLILV